MKRILQSTKALQKTCSERAGCVALRRHAVSGKIIGIYRAREADMDDKGWAVVCEKHNTFVVVPSQRNAMCTAKCGTQEWCEYCREGTEPEY